MMIFNKRKFVFCTKGETLKNLKDCLTQASIPDLFIFNVYEWAVKTDEIVESIGDIFHDSLIIIRSSSINEDGESSSMAGQFNSIMNVRADDERLAESIQQVIDSYGVSSELNGGKDQIIIQKMVQNVSMSGVIFTQDINTGAPYYVINYDDQTGRTDTVTAGKEYSNRTLFVIRDSVSQLQSSRFIKLLKAVDEIEGLTGSDTLDIEFALDKDELVYILQVRPITTKVNWNRGLSLRINDAVKRIQHFVNRRSRRLPHIFGARSIFGQMPDWNPAEIIGASPRPLAFSLYRRLITDSAWRIARQQMGYSEPLGARLISSLGGKPYVDVRYSFHSFLPKDIEPRIANKLVDAWLERLSQHRELHDKIEFEIAVTAYFPDFDETMSTLYPDLLNSEEYNSFKEVLLNFTNRLLAGDVCPIEKELEKIRKLEILRENLVRSDSRDDLLTATALLEKCIGLGTIPFSILARQAFIAKGFLCSLERMQIISDDESTAFQKSIQTVAGEFLVDLHELEESELSKKSFMDKYGHLRPGTYDILSLRYDQRKHLISSKGQFSGLDYSPFKFTRTKEKKITEALKKCGYKVTAKELFEYIQGGTIARESAKFVFTHAISDALEIIALWGEKHCLSREELSYISIQYLLDGGMTTDGRSLESHLRGLSQKGKEEHELSLALHLPHIIDCSADVAIVPLLLNRPNFVTKKSVQGKILKIDERFEEAALLDNMILLIESADPGFDWIFSRPIKGLITKFGGVNSHMAIRCAEFGLPAAIGCGEQIFDRLTRSNYIELNCAEQLLVPVDH